MSLLPTNSSPLLKKLTALNNPEIDHAIVELYRVKSDPSDHLLLWLIWEYGLESVLPYSQDLRSIIQEGLIWQRVRGTPKSLQMACDWLGLADTQVEESKPGRYFYEYQLNTTAIPGDQTIKKLIKLSKMSTPVRSRLSRVFYGLDIRVLELSGEKSTHQFGGYLSDHSGTFFDGKDEHYLKLSFKRSHSASNQIQPINIDSYLSRYFSKKQAYTQQMNFGEIYLGRKVTGHFEGVVQYARLYSAKIGLTGRAWLGRWEGIPWTQSDYVTVAIKHYQVSSLNINQHYISVSDLNYSDSSFQKRQRIAMEFNVLKAPEISITLEHHYPYEVYLGNGTWLGHWGECAWHNTSYLSFSLTHHSLS